LKEIKLRIRLTFAKTDAMRFTGHLDLHRTWERTIRRAGLPLAYTQGFSPHPRINLASALPLGFTGEAEVVDIWLEHPLSLEEINAALQPALPPGLKVSQIEEADPHAPSLQTELEASEFHITFLEPVPNLAERCTALLQATCLPRRRRDKDYDLRSLIQKLELLPPDPHGNQRLVVQLSAQQSATGRPEEVIDALDASPEAARVHRTRLIFQANEKTLT
jgi:radical SAM-linked protein